MKEYKKEFHDNGNVEREYVLEDGKKEGIERWYYQFGQLMVESPFVNDKLHGVCKGFYSSGELMWKKTYDKDVEVGTETWFFPSGEVSKEVFHKGKDGNKNGLVNSRFTGDLQEG